jgi:hypothetical protein
MSSGDRFGKLLVPAVVDGVSGIAGNVPAVVSGVPGTAGNVPPVVGGVPGTAGIVPAVSGGVLGTVGNVEPSQNHLEWTNIKVEARHWRKAERRRRQAEFQLCQLAANLLCEHIYCSIVSKY